ncbi:MAG: site-2 protease family protein [Oscillospiraceae bacterium]|nr:site-2 protease family protein [Oscillospiraceae bacterium]
MLFRYFQNIGENTPMQEIVVSLITMILAVLICMVIHELCHGLAAYALGDQTAKNMGRLTLNPVRHIDPIGSLMLLFVGFGWAKPVQIDPRYFRDPKRDMALTALAGPFSNFIFAFLIAGLFALVYSLSGASQELAFFYNKSNFYNALWALGEHWGVAGLFVGRLFLYLIFYNVALGVFNLLPIPPLDGSKVLASFLPNRAYWAMMQYERYGMFLIMFLALTGALGGYLQTFLDGILSLIFKVFGLSY